MSKIEDSYSRELLEIRKALEIAEEKRFASGLTALEKKELEQASIVLRTREREIISKIGKEIADSIKNSGVKLETLAKNIRVHTKKMGHTTHSLEKVKKALLTIAKLSQSYLENID
ncbi:MAG: hypothetical protein WCR71_05875 [Bacteroidales bacterium]